jgi:DNA invertase Pin-like site-specific DNA recombinase
VHRWQLKAKGVSLRILDLNIDTSTATGELVLNLMGSIAQFERSMMLERQREGIAKAKSEGHYKGRKPTIVTRADQIRALAAEGHSMGEIAKRLGIGKGSVHRTLRAA